MRNETVPKKTIKAKYVCNEIEGYTRAKKNFFPREHKTNIQINKNKLSGLAPASRNNKPVGANQSIGNSTKITRSKVCRINYI